MSFKVIGLDGKEQKIQLYKYLYDKCERQLSGPASHCIEVIKEVFPLYEICVEIPIKVNGKTLYLDIFLPKIKLAVEVHGRQHSSYTKHFHGSLEGFAKSVSRDGDKAELLDNNGITLITLFDGEQKTWKSRLENWMLS